MSDKYRLQEERARVELAVREFRRDHLIDLGRELTKVAEGVSMSADDFETLVRQTATQSLNTALGIFLLPARVTILRKD